MSRWPLPWTSFAAALVILWRRRKSVVAAAIALSFVAYLRPGELATLRVRNLVAPDRPGTKGATGRFSLVIREEERGIPSKTHTFDHSVILDRPDLLWMDRFWQLWGVQVAPRLIPMDQNEIAREVKTIFEELVCSKLGVVAYGLRHGGPSWDFMDKFRNLDEIQQQVRWRSPTSVLRYQKALKPLSAMQLVEPRQAEFGRYCEDNLERLLAAPMGGRSFPWTAHQCFIEIGSTMASVSRAVKRRGVLAETWNPWYGPERDISGR